MFDTGQASRVLGLKSAGLAFLLLEFCGVIADKKYQLADWRARPLPEEMLKYARDDTHYLLYIHDVLKKQLLERSQDSYRTVMRKSQSICLNQFQKPVVKDYNYFMIIQRNKQTSSI
jgi:exosome complex exonuclease RRP6